MDTPTVLSLYSGGGGLDLGFRLAVRGARTVCYVEREVSACALLVDHMQTGQLDDAPLWSDSGTFDGRPWRGKVDWIIGGFPCQPFSVAGKQLGTEDERWLWPHIERIAGEVQPSGLFLENVPALVSGGGLAEVLGGLASLGYDAEWITVRASDVGAPHRRERVFILAHCQGSRSRGLSIRSGRSQQTNPDIDRGNSGVDDSESQRTGQDGDHQRAPDRDGDTSEHSGEPLARSNDESRDIFKRRLRPEPDRDGRELGDTESIKPWSRKAWSGKSGSATRSGRDMEWPPGPADTDAWAAILRERPDLAPAVDHPASAQSKRQQETASVREQRVCGISGSENDRQETPESEVRGMADGTPRGLARTDRLRILGNGVVPAQAALAFRELACRVGAVGV
ncbi:MAG: DNA cytosine methyltransferase [Planctomycetes bacterium]|nr:DNA cytosine methyltransferase [Planctomycetota bacterium]